MSDLLASGIIKSGEKDSRHGPIIEERYLWDIPYHLLGSIFRYRTDPTRYTHVELGQHTACEV
jgi:hypothetical protein